MAESNFFWDSLLELIEEGQVVPIVGQGLLTIRHQERECLLYPLLAERLAASLGVSGEDLPAGDELNTVICRRLAAEPRIELEQLYSKVKKILPAENDLEIPEPLLQLAAIRPFKLFVTTTFDPLLVHAINRVRFGGQDQTRVLVYVPNSVEDLPKPLDELERPVVYHLFGKASAIPSSFTLTQEDVVEFLHSLQSESRQPKRLFFELNRRSLLIAGSSFGGWLTRFFLRTPKSQRLIHGGRPMDYLAEGSQHSDASLALFLHHFSRTQVYGDGNAPEFVAELHRRWMECHPPKSAETPESLPGRLDGSRGAVFLSYASEDRKAASKIKDHLETAGIDVFFDENDLEAGDRFDSKLLRAINECSLFLPVLSRNTLTGPMRRYFRKEWTEALNQARMAAESERFLYPVAIDGVGTAEVEIPKAFRDIEWERAPDGEVSPEFVRGILSHFRRYRLALAGLK